VSNYLDNTPIPGIEWSFDMTKKLLPTIQLEEIGALINDFLHDDNRVIILTGPEKEGLKQVTEDEVKALLKEVQSGDIVGYKDEAVRNEFYKKTDFKNDEVLFSAYSPGGTSLYSDADYIATTFANGGLSQAGIGGLSLTDINKFMSGKIANVSPSIGAFSENFRGSAAPKDLETLFQMVHLYFTDLNKDDEAYNSFITKQKSFLGNLMANPQFYFPGKNSNENYIATKFRRKDAFQKHIINRGKDPKSNVSIVWEEEIPYDGKTALAVAALGEVLTIKLVEKLREEEGGVYGVGE